MFRSLIARLPSNHHEFDPLFKDDLFPPNLSPRAVLYWAYDSNIRYAEEEDTAPQNRDYCRLVREVFSDGNYELPTDLTPRQFAMMRAAHACCFERSPSFTAALQNVRDPWFAKLLVDTRLKLLPEHAAHCAALEARKTHYARMQECLNTPLDIVGSSTLDLIKQMGPDDWHEMVLRWNWDQGVTELDWMTSQPECDRATAAVALFMGEPTGDKAKARTPHPDPKWDYEGFVFAVAERLEQRFFTRAELDLGIPMRERKLYQQSLDKLRGIGLSPWLLPPDLVSHSGRRHQPKYGYNDGDLHFHYEFWLTHIAPVRN